MTRKIFREDRGMVFQESKNVELKAIVGDDAALRVSNMIRVAIKSDLTMFLHYETLEVEGKHVVVIDIQRGIERPYYMSKKGLRPEGVYGLAAHCLGNSKKLWLAKERGN